MNPNSWKTATKEIRSLTGLRGVAAFMVVLYHLGGHHLGQGVARQLVEHGYLWVDLFFSLSGFVLAITYTKYFAAGLKASALQKFTLERIARIFPLFWFVTLLGFGRAQMYSHFGLAVHGATSAVPVPPTAFTLVTNLLLIQAWGLAGSIVGPGWSLSTEWAVSLAFPLLASIIMISHRSGAWLLLVISLLSLGWLGLLPPSLTGAVGVRGPMDMTTGTSYAPLLRCFADFTLGMIALRVSADERVRRVAAHSGPSLLIAAAVIILLCIPQTDLAVILLFPVFIVSVSFGKPFVGRVLSSAPLHHLGKVSYSLYLIHTLLIPYDAKIVRILTRVRPPLPADVGLVLSIALAIGVATLTYRWIEVPGRLILRRWFGLCRARRRSIRCWRHHDTSARWGDGADP